MGASLKKLENLGNISLFPEIYQKNEGKAILWDSLPGLAVVPFDFLLEFSESIF